MENRKTVTVVTPEFSATQLISTVDMQSFMRVEAGTDDALIAEFVKSATERMGQYLRRTIVAATFDFTMDRFSDGGCYADNLAEGVYDLPRSYGMDSQVIHLPFPPIASISSIKTYDRANAESTVSALAYRLDTPGGRIYLNDGYTWPTSLRDKQAVVIRCAAGYGWTNVPRVIRDAVRDYAAAMYDCRRACDMPDKIVSDISPYRILDEGAFY